MKIKHAFSGMLLLFTATTANAQKFDLLIGTAAGPGTGEGIYTYTFDSKTGELVYLNKLVIDNPTYLAMGPDKKHVYSVNQVPRIPGSISALSYDHPTGKLTFINKATSGGEGPCYVSVDGNGRFAFAANYTAGTLSAIPIAADGSLSQEVQTLTFTGSGPNVRQNKPYLHCAAVSPDNEYLFADDLGTDKTYVYHINYGKGQVPLTPADPAFIASQPGSGPRHLTFHPNKKFAYIVYELGGIVNTFSYEQGSLKLLQTSSMLPDGFKGNVTSADIHLSPDGKFLYASNRIDLNEIVIFKVDQKTGRLTYVGRQSSLGKIPRNFAIDPTGNFLLAANQDTNDIFVFRRDKKTGMLTPSGIKLAIPKPTCLKFGEERGG